MRKELARFTLLDIVKFPFASLEAMCVGKNILNNPNIITREDDVLNGDIIFYEEVV